MIVKVFLQEVIVFFDYRYELSLIFLANIRTHCLPTRLFHVDDIDSGGKSVKRVLNYKLGKIQRAAGRSSHRPSGKIN